MNLNNAQVIGRITKTPEVRMTPSGLKVVSFSVATNRVWKDKQGQKQQEAEFHNIVAFGRTGEIIAQWFNQGDEIYIQGRLKTSSWDDKTGAKRYKTDIIAERLDFGQKKQQGATTASTEQPAKADGLIEDEEINIADIPF